MFFLSVLEPLSAEKNSTILEYFSKKESKSTENKTFPATTDDFSDVPDDFFDDVMEDTQWEPPPKKMKMLDTWFVFKYKFITLIKGWLLGTK